jgi:hypothetical protein
MGNISYYKLRPGESAIFDCNDDAPYEVLESDGNWRPVNFLNETSRFCVPMTSKSRLNNLEVFRAMVDPKYPYELQVCVRGEDNEEIGAFRILKEKRYGYRV